ncbi:MAG TPA: hypothetical protein VGG75_38280 [Trebonia sp.]|jgi:hypothetical protein
MTSIDKAIANALTADAQAHAAPERPEVVIVVVPPDSKLEGWLCLGDPRKSALEAAEAAHGEWKDAVIAELQRMYPGETAPTKGYEIPGGPMWSSLSVSWQNGKEYLPTDLIKQHIPQVWSAFKKQSRGFWIIRRKAKR